MSRTIVNFTPAGNPITHGLPSSYATYGCRCPLCTDSNRSRSIPARKRREEMTKNGRLPDSVPHGRYTTYTNWGCRCEPCTKAQTEKCKSYYHRNLSAEARQQLGQECYDEGYSDGKAGKPKRKVVIKEES